jgi:hypothetical protein
MIDSIYLKDVLREITSLPEDADTDKIDQTRRELEGYNWSPMLTVDIPDFLSATKTDIIRFLKDMTAQQLQDMKNEDLSLIVYHYKLLRKLRRNDPEGWDYITELMVED